MSTRRKSARQRDKPAVSYSEVDEPQPVKLLLNSDDEKDEQVDGEEEVDAAILKKRNERLRAERAKEIERQANEARQDTDFQAPAAVKAFNKNKPPRTRKLKRFIPDVTPEVKKEESEDETPTSGLSQFLEMPLDIVTMVLGELEPLCLLRVSRCNKQLHDWLGSKTAIPIWVKARAGLSFMHKKYNYRRYNENGLVNPDEPAYIEELVTVPPRPEGWTEMAYASLCHEAGPCDRPGCGNSNNLIVPHLLKRFCQECRSKFFVSRADACRMFKQGMKKRRFLDDIFRIVPMTSPGYFYIYESKPMYEELERMQATLNPQAYERWLQDKEEGIASMKTFGRDLTTSLERLRNKQCMEDRDRLEAKERRLEEERDEKRQQKTARLDALKAECCEVGDVQTQDVTEVIEEYDISYELWERMDHPDARTDLIETVIDRARQLGAFRLEEQHYQEHDLTRSRLASSFRASFAEPLSLLPIGELYALPAVLPFFTLAPGSIEDYQEQWDKSLNAIRRQALRRCLVILQDLHTMSVRAKTDLGILASRFEAGSEPDSEEEEPEIDPLDVGVWKHICLLWKKLSHLSMVFFKCKVCRETYHVGLLLRHNHITHQQVRRSYQHAHPERGTGWDYEDDYILRHAPWCIDLVEKPAGLAFASHLLCKAIADEADDADLPDCEIQAPATMKQMADFDRNWKLWCNYPSCVPPQPKESKMGFIVDQHDTLLRKTYTSILAHIAHHCAEAQEGREVLIKAKHIEVIRA